jgi:acetylglutamate/LysW-gamma-L-alpha-aminoadipate kinase
VNAVGLSGIDGAIWKGRRKKAVRAIEDGRQRIIRDNLTGKVETVNVSLLTGLLDEGYLPVLTPPALSLDGDAINVDGDRAAAATAIALEAEKLLLLSNVPGVLSNFPDEGSLIRQIQRGDIDKTIKDHAQGRMRIKLLGAKEALSGGVRQVILGDSRGDGPVLRALSGHGTLIQ